MSEWKEYKLKDAPLKIIDGDRGKNYPSQNEFSRMDYCLFLSTRNVKKEGFDFSERQFISQEKDNLLRKGKLKRNDIVLTTRGTVGNLAHYNEKVVFENLRINSGMIIIRPDESALLPSYCFYLFRALQKDFETFTSGSAQPQLPIKDLNEMVVLLPDLQEQKIIAYILSSLDDKIDLLNRQNKTLEAFAKTIFREWFVKEANESWEEKILYELVDFNPREKVDLNREYNFFEMNCLSNDSMSIKEGNNRIVKSGSNFRNGDVLLAKITPCLENGKTGLVMNLGVDEIGRGSTEFIVMRAKKDISQYWIYCLSRDEDFRDLAILSMTGTSGRQRVQLDVLKNYPIKFKQEIMIEFDKRVKPYFEKVKTNQNQIRILTKLRDTLLPKLMSGEVRVKI